LTNSKSNIADQMEEWKINEIINYILESGWEIVLLPHSFHEKNIPSNDYIFLKQFLRKDTLQKYPKKIVITKSMSQTYSYYKENKIDICLAQRLHSIILSHVYEIPFIGISYWRKTDEILQSLEITKN
jgi:polysaccharide pyruvyl transferase WcaK-like protein